MFVQSDGILWGSIYKCTGIVRCGRTGGRRIVIFSMSFCFLRTGHAILLENAFSFAEERLEEDPPLGSYLTADNLGPCLSRWVVEKYPVCAVEIIRMIIVLDTRVRNGTKL